MDEADRIVARTGIVSAVIVVVTFETFMAFEKRDSANLLSSSIRSLDRPCLELKVEGQFIKNAEMI